MDSERLRDRLRALLDPAPSVTLPASTSPAAVLVPVLGAAPEPRVVFTKRTETLSRHAGEISFPGGLADPGEELAATALREAQEELGLAPSDVELVGSLPPVHTHVTGILIVPFVGFLWKDPRFTPNAAEIAGVLEFPLATLIKAGRLQEFQYDGRRFETYLYEMDGGVIWGATGRILASFIQAVDATPKGKRQ
ncbi:MAG TPA: CoA pyrophosphatase [Actinomycetota bacterium]